MRKDYSSSIVLQCFLYHLARVDRAAIDRPSEQLQVSNQTVTGIQGDHAENFVFKFRERQPQVVPHGTRRLKAAASTKSARDRNSRGCNQLLRSRRPKVGMVTDVQGSKGVRFV
jgi:hypothetical protein